MKIRELLNTLKVVHPDSLDNECVLITSNDEGVKYVPIKVIGWTPEMDNPLLSNLFIFSK